MATEQQYYEYLTRTDHPVFARDFSAVQDKNSPFNSILNRVLAKQLVKLRADLDEFKLNRFPHTCTAVGIDAWEETYFGYSKTGEGLQQRISELVIRINAKIPMTVGYVSALAASITGVTPFVVIRNAYVGGWILGKSPLGVSTILSGGNQSDRAFLYVVIFTQAIDSTLLATFDEELTRIEKGGSRHTIICSPLA